MARAPYYARAQAEVFLPAPRQGPDAAASGWRQPARHPLRPCVAGRGQGSQQPGPPKRNEMGRSAQVVTNFPFCRRWCGFGGLASVERMRAVGVRVRGPNLISSDVSSALHWNRPSINGSV